MGRRQSDPYITGDGDYSAAYQVPALTSLQKDRQQNGGLFAMMIMRNPFPHFDTQSYMRGW